MTVPGRVRTGLLLLAAAGIAGTALELAMLRHWDSQEQLLAWVALVPLVVALGVVAGQRAGGRSPVVLRVLLLAIVAFSAFGMWEHVEANHEAGPLDRGYSAVWDSMSSTSQWWAAVSGSVGPSPTLAPAIYLQAAGCLLLASWLGPAAGRARSEERELLGSTADG